MLVEKAHTLSTNDDARALAVEGAPHGAMVLAATQSVGRGRAGRSFLSPEGGLYLSVVLRPRAPPARWSVLPLVAGAAAAWALRERGWLAELKWPNDLMLGGRKLGGVLVESRLDARPFAIVGVGLNVDAAPEGVEGCTALAAHGPPPQRRAMAEAIRARLLERVARLDAQGAAGVMPQVRALCATLGRRVVWDKNEGCAVDVDDEGALVVETRDARVRVVAGDVRVRAR